MHTILGGMSVIQWLLKRITCHPLLECHTLYRIIFYIRTWTVHYTVWLTASYGNVRLMALASIVQVLVSLDRGRDFWVQITRLSSSVRQDVSDPKRAYIFAKVQNKSCQAINKFCVLVTDEGPSAAKHVAQAFLANTEPTVGCVCTCHGRSYRAMAGQHCHI